jgi:hypothetical protein
VVAGRFWSDDPPDQPSYEAVLGAEVAHRYCCELPTGQDETVYVSAAKGVRLFYDPLRVYKVRGLFEAGIQTDPAHGVSLFRLRQAHVEEAVGAKIMPLEDTPAAPR